jgi:hypothetical protein
LRFVTGGIIMTPGRLEFVLLAGIADGLPATAGVVNSGKGAGIGLDADAAGAAGVSCAAGAVGAAGVIFMEVGMITSPVFASTRAGSVFFADRGLNMLCIRPPLPIGGRLLVGALGVISIEEDETPLETLGAETVGND